MSPSYAKRSRYFESNLVRCLLVFLFYISDYIVLVPDTIRPLIFLNLFCINLVSALVYFWWLKKQYPTNEKSAASVVLAKFSTSRM